MDTKPRIVLVEDHGLVLEGFRLELQGEFNIVGMLSSGGKVAEECGRLQPDLVLLDLNLPQRGGLELIGDVLSASPKTRILVVTMYTDPLLADVSFQEGATGFIPKDAEVDELRHAMGEVLAGRRYLSPLVAKRSPQYSCAEVSLGMARLTPQQQRIMRLLGEGKSTACIAKALSVSPFTITFHRGRIRKALGIRDEFGLIRHAMLVRITEEHPL